MGKNYIYLVNIFVLSGTILFLIPMASCSNIIQTARVSMSKIKGTVTFTQSSDPSISTHIQFDLNGVVEDLRVQVYSLPMLYEGGPQRSCRSAAIGTVYNPTDSASGDCSKTNQSKCAVGDLSGKIGNINNASAKNNFTDLNLPLSGKYSIYSRTLVFMTTSGVAKACALIDRNFGPGRTAVAQFKGPVAGSVYFRQVIENEVTLMYVNLFFVDKSVSQKEYFLAIHDKPIKDKFGPDQCSDIGEQYNPFKITSLTNCKKTNHAGCPVGDLKTKDGYMNVTSATSGLSSTQVAYTDANLPINGNKAVIGHSLVLYSRDAPSKPVACANISEVLRKVAKAIFDADTADGVFGFFIFRQPSPFDATDVQFEMSNLRKKAEGFHVHEYPNPVYQHIKDNKVACSLAVAGDHLNPYRIDPSKSPPNGIGTFDEYEIGDLSAKYGSFLNLNNRNGRYTDYNLPLYGRYSIIGRSLVVHHLKKDGNKRWICVNVNLRSASSITFNAGSLVDITKPTPNITVLSHFTGPDITGDIMMRQYQVPLGFTTAAPFDTEMYLNLSLKSGEKTRNHNWHVHEKLVGDDMRKGVSSGRCDSPGPHYNPYVVYVEGNYKATCTPDNPLRCELGDSSAKNAQYSLGSGPRFYTDVDTPLSGTYSVVKRSIVVHVKNGGPERQGCADIEPYPKAVVVPQGHAAHVTALLSHVALSILALLLLA